MSLVFNVSGTYPQLLRKRALSSLKWAERALAEGDYDFAVREAEYAIQLFLKSIIYRIAGEEVRGHNIRELLSVLTSALIEEGLNDEAFRIVEYVRKHRRELAELAYAHTKATYGLLEYGEKEAKIIFNIVKNLMEELEKLEAKIFGQESP